MRVRRKGKGGREAEREGGNKIKKEENLTRSEELVGVVAHACNSNTREGQEFKVRVGYIHSKTLLKKKNSQEQIA